MADVTRMRRCAERVAAAVKQGHRVVVVVSARGDTTDDLLELAGEITRTPDRRELDQLLACGEQISIALMTLMLQSIGVSAVSLTGQQCGIHTDGVFGRARITRVDGSRIEHDLSQGRVPVVAGFQGICCEGDVTTLGRGGSDTTAVALAAAIQADECQIFTDVDGVYTTDPRLAPGAKALARISYDEMMEAASQGAQVMHPRAVELGKKHGVAIRVLHSQREGAGTLITDAVSAMEESGGKGRAVSIVALKPNIGRFTLSDLPDQAGLQQSIFERIGAAGINVDDIIQVTPRPHAEQPGGCSIVFTVDRGDLTQVQPLVESALRALGCGRFSIDTGLSKVSAVGVGMQSQSGVAGLMFKALADAGIRIANITTSEIKISCLVDEADGKRGLQVVHDAFGLGAGAEVTVRTGEVRTV